MIQNDPTCRKAQLKENVPLPSLQSIPTPASWPGLACHLSCQRKKMEGKLIKSLDFPYVLAYRSSCKNCTRSAVSSNHALSITNLSTQLLLPQILLTRRDVECRISKRPRKNQIYHRPIKQSSSPHRHLASALASCCRPARLRSQGNTGTAPESHPTFLWGCLGFPYPQSLHCHQHHRTPERCQGDGTVLCWDDFRVQVIFYLSVQVQVAWFSISVIGRDDIRANDLVMPAVLLIWFGPGWFVACLSTE